MTQTLRTRRRQVYIDKPFQWRFILRFCLILLVGVIFSSVLLYYFSQGTLTSTFTNSRLVIQPTGMAILPVILWTNLITLGLILVAAIIVTLYISHKIAGPIFRLEKEISRIAQGDLTVHVSLRSKDQMQAFAEQVNAMTTELNRRVAGIRTQADAMLQAAENASEGRQVREMARALDRYIQEQFTL